MKPITRKLKLMRQEASDAEAMKMKKKPDTNRKLRNDWRWPLIKHMAGYGIVLYGRDLETMTAIFEQCQQRRILAVLPPRADMERARRKEERQQRRAAPLAPKVKAVGNGARPKIVDTGCRCFRCINVAAMAMKPARRKPRGMTYKGQDEI